MPRRLCKGCNAYTIPKDADKRLKVCSDACRDKVIAEAIAKVRARNLAQARKLAKLDKQKHAKRKREFYDNDIKTRKAAAIKEFNAYIRERDKGLPCICCGKPISPDDYAAGHYIPAGSNSLLRFDEVNVNGQRNNECNKHKSGNQAGYKVGLVAKWGEAELERLETTNGTIKRTAQDYKAIEVEYREKRKALITQLEDAA